MRNASLPQNVPDWLACTIVSNFIYVDCSLCCQATRRQLLRAVDLNAATKHENPHNVMNIDNELRNASIDV